MCQKKVVNNSPESFEIGSLPPLIIGEIYKSGLTLEEIVKLLRTRPPVFVCLDEGRLYLKLNINISIKKTVAWVTGLISFVWAILKFTFDYLPSIRDWLS